ncbi:MAG: hypothetical protein ACKVS8_01715 [Phycisphaerales bacterium]
MNVRINTSVRLALLASLAGLATSAQVSLAQPSADAPLGGPPVTQRDVPGNDGGFSGMAQPLSNKDRGDAVPHRAFMQSIREALGKDAPEALRLTEDQRAAIESASREYQAQMQTFMQEHKGELGDVRGKFGKAGFPTEGKGGGKGKGDRARAGEGMPPAPPVGEPEANAEQKAALESLKALRSQMPRPDDTHTKIWATLRPDQKQAVEGRLEGFKKQRAEREGEAFAKRKSKELAGGKLDPANLDKLLERVPEARREQLKKRLEGMTPEQRQEFIEKMRERGGKGKGRGGDPTDASRPKG